MLHGVDALVFGRIVRLLIGSVRLLEAVSAPGSHTPTAEGSADFVPMVYWILITEQRHQTDCWHRYSKEFIATATSKQFKCACGWIVYTKRAAQKTRQAGKFLFCLFGSPDEAGAKKKVARCEKLENPSKSRGPKRDREKADSSDRDNDAKGDGSDADPKEKQRHPRF